MRKSRRGWAELAVGLLLLAAALGLWQDNARSDRRAAAGSQQLLTQVRRQIEAGHGPPSAPPPRSQQKDPPSRPQPETPRPPPGADPVSGDLETSETLGILEIPALSLTLPVWAEWGEERLQRAPCRYVPPGESQPPFVICGHNYSSQFGGLSRLAAGEGVDFTDLEGRVQRYTVSELITVPQDDVAALEAGDWDLTLFTCTPSRVSRVLVRCRRG